MNIIVEEKDSHEIGDVLALDNGNTQKDMHVTEENLQMQGQYEEEYDENL